MSLNFWLNLTLAISGLFLSLALIRSWKRGLIRDWRARSLRQRLIPLVQSLLKSLLSKDLNAVCQDLDFYRLREQTEELYRKSSPLSQEERVGLANFLSAISSLQAKVQTDPDNTYLEKEEVILRGQRTAQDMQEMGL